MSTVLVVDDEASIRGLVRNILAPKGYTVYEAADGLAAFKVIEALRGKLDVLLTDIRMPKLDGVALAQKVTAEYPSINVLYMSAYLASFTKLPDQSILAKPFAPSALLDMVETSRSARLSAAPRGSQMGQLCQTNSAVEAAGPDLFDSILL